MAKIRSALGKINAKKPARKPVRAGNQAAANAVKHAWNTQDAIRDANARILALGDIVEDIPGVAERLEREHERKAYAKVWAGNPEGSMLMLHSLAGGLYGDAADTVLKIASGADVPFSSDEAARKWGDKYVGVDPKFYSTVIGQFCRLTMPSLYSRRPAFDDEGVDEIFAIYEIPRLDANESEAKAKELHNRLWDASDRFAGWNVQDTNPYAIVHGIYERVWGVAPPTTSAKVAASTFQNLEWPSPWRVDDYLFTGMTRATVGDWNDPCPVGLLELEMILDAAAAGNGFGIRQWVLELGPFNVAKGVKDDDSVSFESVPTTNTVEVGADNGD